jgi:hypothetical protein
MKSYVGEAAQIEEGLFIGEKERNEVDRKQK